MNIKKKQTKSSALAFSKWLSEMEDKPIDTSQNHEKKGREKSDEIQTQSTIIDYLELRALKGELFFQRGVYKDLKEYRIFGIKFYLVFAPKNEKQG